MTTKLFGEPVRRREDARLIAGNGRYLDDLGAGALAVAFVRSPHAHALITGIDVDDAIDVEGLVAIYTWEDLPAGVREPLPLLIPHPALTHGRTAYCLAKDVVRHVGEPIVMVVATDRYVAEDVCERIQVSYEFLKPVVGLENARQRPHLVHDDVPGNVGAHMVQEVAHQDGRATRDVIAAAPPRWSSGSTSSGRPACRWRARACTPAGTPTTGRCASTAPPRPPPACGWPSRPSSGCRCPRSRSSRPTSAAGSA